MRMPCPMRSCSDQSVGGRVLVSLDRWPVRERTVTVCVDEMGRGHDLNLAVSAARMLVLVKANGTDGRGAIKMSSANSQLPARCAVLQSSPYRPCVHFAKPKGLEVHVHRYPCS
uniref:Uncharacterized protein n=1 Tax=Prymnesium polylepis TaxID=72548 RepID=A0A7S4KHP1_9EUKA|mmetsp:Transcript_46346/g.136912  ORF Transcript_46346/g.136912 Transcript_46346/m.136912 type:complete len:114 (-) Transcript_46346:56-397(-)